MLTTYKIDQTRTFGSLLLVAVERKAAFGDQYRQETTKDGVPKWVLALVAEFRAFGKPVRELINVGIAAGKDPGTGLLLPTPVELIDFEIGVMEKTKRDPQTSEERVVGVQVWYRCAEVRPTSATDADRKARSSSAFAGAVTS